MYPIRLRAHLLERGRDANPNAVDQSTTPLERAPQRSQQYSDRRALFLFGIYNQQDQLDGVVARETVDGRTVRELIAIHADSDPLDAVTWASHRRQDVPRGIVAAIEVIDFEELGQLIAKRCYRYGVTLLGWHLGSELCHLAAHVGRSVGGAFSISLPGCGKVVDDKWRDSDYYPRLRVTPRGGDTPAFVRWLAPRDTGSLPSGLRPRFVDLANLLPAVAGGAVTSIERATELFGIDVRDELQELDLARARCAALVALYAEGCRRLRKFSPGLLPHLAFSTGSLVAHNRRQVQFPLQVTK